MATPMEMEELPEAAAPAVAAGGLDGVEKPDAAPVDSGSDSDSSDSDDEGCGGDAAAELRIQALEHALQEQPLDYDSHVQYIQCLRKSGNIDKLRAGREEMNMHFPLAPKMWQDWAKDEISLSTGPESFGDIEKLYERGVQEYLSVKLWRDYLDYVEEHDHSVAQSSPSGLSKMRDLFERAITAGGLHVTEGSKLWEDYRDYEMAVLTTIDGDVNAEEKERQVQRVRVLFHRQLSVPLADLESTLAEYKRWETEQGNANDPDSNSDTVPSNVMSAYRKASEMYNARKQYEDELSNVGASEAEKLQVFLKYIKFEESCGEPARVQVLYERAVSELPVSSDIWMGYTSYLDRTLKVPAILKSVYHRATRNCTWVSDLWVRYMLSLERIHSSEDELRHVFEQAVQCSFPSIQEYLEIYLTRIDSLRRRMSDGLDFQLIRQAFMSASELPQLGTEELLLVHTYWAKLEVDLGKDLAASRGVWENALKKSGSVLEVWQHYISMEIGMGYIHEARSLYKRCYTKRFTGTGSEDICHSWIRFERQHGTLDDYDLAVKKVTPRLMEIMTFKAQQDAKVDPYSVPKETSDHANDSSQKRKPSKMSSKLLPPAKKRKENPPKSNMPSEDRGSKEQSGNSSVLEAGEVSKEKAEVPMEIQAEDGNKRGNISSNEPKPHFYEDKCTVYMSNIDLTANEEDIRHFFSDIGGVTSIRMLRDRFTKKPRGLAYVDFSDREHLDAAIRKNKQKLLQKKVSVARSDPSKSKKNREAGSLPRSQYNLLPGGDPSEKAADSNRSGKEVPKGDMKITGKATFAAPRSVVKPLGWTTRAEKSDGGAEELKSNEEFRNLLLKK